MQDTLAAVITVNGGAQPLRAETIAGLLAEREIDPSGRGLAIAVNGSVVPRAQWPQTRLTSGDSVEIVQAKQGG